MKRTILFFLLFFFAFTPTTFATSNYVLPYPSTMPGSVFYKLHLVEEAVMKYWYYGEFGKFDYNRKLSDKYLVEAKTLFEYQQFLLGYKALQKSNAYFQEITPALSTARLHGKDVSEKEALFLSETEKHEEVLTAMLENTPEVFQWTPEKSPSSMLYLHGLISSSIAIRKQAL
ncbi:MAG: hypothetical protein ACREGI_04490 [Candidatus Levyibacteriota bacterium]